MSTHYQNDDPFPYTGRAKFEQGAVVRLKSSGPTMTVEEPARYPRLGDTTDWRPTKVKCVWFDEHNTQRFAYFDEGVLERVKLGNL